MIPELYLAEWRQYAPWPDNQQIEQDLIISRALVEIYSHPLLANALAFRGGTALYKLFIQPAKRYSEDIDLVQTKAGPIGPIVNALREKLDSWLGEPKRKFNQGRATLHYRFQVEGSDTSARLKIEINTREHFSVLGFAKKSFSIESQWFTGAADIQTYHFNELMGTKLRALYSRKKGRDLFDLEQAMKHREFDTATVLKVFEKYMAFEKRRMSRAEFEENLFMKLQSPIFTQDMSGLIAMGDEWGIHDAFDHIQRNLVPHLKGEPWQRPEVKTA